MSSNNGSTPTKSTEDFSSPSKFIKPADLFKMRRRSSNQNSNSNHAIFMNNSASAQPKAGTSSNLMLKSVPSSPNSFQKIAVHSLQASPFKAPLGFSIDSQSPLKCLSNITDPSPTKKLPVVLRNPFNRPAKRRLNLGFSPRKSPTKKTRMLGIDEDANLDPPKMKKTPAIRIPPSTKKMRDIFQHPYFSWLPLFPRVADTDNRFCLSFTKHPEVLQVLRKDWCESLDDVTDLLLNGRCSMFYVCYDDHNIQIKRIAKQDKPDTVTDEPSYQALISPFFWGMSSALDKEKIKYRFPENSRGNSLSRNESRTSFGSMDEETTQSQSQPQTSKPSSSVDSGNVSDVDDEDYGSDENEDESQFLEKLGWDTKEVNQTLKSNRGGFVDTCSNAESTQLKKNLPLAIIDGVEDVRKLIDYLKAKATKKFIGKYACIPPTLLSPCDFRLSTKNSIPQGVLEKMFEDIIY